MKKLNIIKSNTEPDKNNLWLKDGEIKEFNGSWKSITKPDSNNSYSYKAYIEAGGSKTESEFYIALKELIDA